MSENHGQHKPEDFFWLPQFEISFHDFECEGFILDIGAGGENVIGQLKGDQVIGIDRNKSELEEAEEGGIKIIMDATDLQFLDNTFNAATAFYCLMYITKPYHKEVLREIRRVLKPGGIFRIWDVSISPPYEEDKIGFVIPLKINLPTRQIETGYGFKWPDSEQNLDYYCQIAVEMGFDILKKVENNQNIYLELQKPLV